MAINETELRLRAGSALNKAAELKPGVQEHTNAVIELSKTLAESPDPLTLMDSIQGKNSVNGNAKLPREKMEEEIRGTIHMADLLASDPKLLESFLNGGSGNHTKEEK